MMKQRTARAHAIINVLLTTHSLLLHVCNDLMQVEIIECHELCVGIDLLRIAESRDLKAIVLRDGKADLPNDIRLDGLWK